MAQVTFDVTFFRTTFVEFTSETIYPTATLQMYWDQAICYISDESNFVLDTTCLTLLINLLTAHLAVINTTINEDDDTNLVKSASIGRVKVDVAIPKIPDQFTWWINQTPYGKQYDALLGVKSTGGLYIGANLGIQAFRGPSGQFNA